MEWSVGSTGLTPPLWGSLSGELPAETSGAPEDTLLPHSVRKKLTNTQTKEERPVSSVYNSWDKSFTVRSMIMKFTKDIKYCCDIQEDLFVRRKGKFCITC